MKILNLFDSLLFFIHLLLSHLLSHLLYYSLLFSFFLSYHCTLVSPANQIFILPYFLIGPESWIVHKFSIFHLSPTIFQVNRFSGKKFLLFLLLLFIILFASLVDDKICIRLVFILFKHVAFFFGLELFL